MKKPIIATLIAVLLASCGSFKKKEVGPYGDKRSNWEKFRSYEEERYDGWIEKLKDREAHERKKEIHSNKKNP